MAWQRLGSCGDKVLVAKVIVVIEDIKGIMKTIVYVGWWSGENG